MCSISRVAVATLGLVYVLIMLGLGGCQTTGPKGFTIAPAAAERPHLRDYLRKEDVVCDDEPDGPVNTQKQINQLTKDKLAWGRTCKAKSNTTWTVIQKEP